MSIVLDGTSGLTSPAAVLTTTPLPVTSGGTGVTTSTGTGANVLGTAPTITGATITVAATAAPAFSAYQSSGQNITTATLTKLTINTEEFDTASCYDNATNYRFTPNVAGYYQVNGVFAFNAPASTSLILIYKNGVRFKDGVLGSSTTLTNQGSNVSALIYMNGSTDYLELYGFQAQGTTSTTSGGSATVVYFQAFLARSA